MRKERLRIVGVVMLAIFVFGAMGWAQDDDPNTVLSSTMVFQGALTDNGDGTYTGTIPMIDEDGTTYGDGESGFDVYAMQGGCAYVQDYYGDDQSNCNGQHDTYVVGYYGNPHDAYTSGGPWGTWYDPDCADWDKYEIELTSDHWYLRYSPTGESPMSGSMDWTELYAAETDLGTQNGGHDGSAAHGGGPQAWDWDCGWGVEVIPLAFPGFNVEITNLGGGEYRVILTPADGRSFGVNPLGPVVNETTGESYGTIQAAIDDATAGDTINVAAGTYNEDLTVDKANLTLKSKEGKDNTTIQLVDGVGIDIQGTGNNFTLGGGEGHGFAIKSGTSTTFEIQLANAPSDVEISYNEIDTTGNATMGISVGAAGASNLRVTNNTFVAEDGDGSIWGPKLVNVTISNNTFTGPTSPASGYAVELAGVTATSPSIISANTITSYSMGIAIFNGEGTSDLTISNNTISECNVGIRIGQYSPSTNGDMTTVSITGNTLKDNTTGLRIDDGANVKASQFTVHLNNFEGNTTGLDNQHTTEVVNAEDNWWGDDSGPSGEGTGTGDAVSTNVDYDPWVKASVVNSTTQDTPGGGTVELQDDQGNTVAEVTTDGDATVTVSNYSDNPSGSGFGNDEIGYFDVYVPDTSALTEITIEIPYDPAQVNEATLTFYWWNGTGWEACSDQGVDTVNHIVWVKIRSDTTPSLNDLQGTIFGAGSGQPASVLWYEDFEYDDQAAMESAGWVFSTNSENLWHLTTEADVPAVAYPNLTPFPSTNHAVWFGSEETGSYAPQNAPDSALPSPEVRAQRARIHTMNGGAGHPYGELTSPEIEVAGQTSVKVSFDYYREVEDYNGPYDKTYVQVSFDNGPWQTVWDRDSSWYSDLVWIPASVDGVPVYGEWWIPVAVPSGATHMRIRFVFDAVDNVANDYLGWLIDELKVSTAGPAGLHFEEENLPEGLVGQAYSTTIHALGGTVGEGGYSWRVISKPSWLTVHPGGTTASLSGTPTLAGTYQLCIGVSDDRGETYSYCYDIVIEEVIGDEGVLFYDDFETADGWTAEGLWHITQNVPCVSPPYASPTHVYYYGKDATCNYVTAGANSGSLTSPVINVSGLVGGSKLTIGWKYWREVEAYDGAYDQSYVEYKFDNQSDWTQIWYDDSSQNQPMGGWHLVEATTDTSGNDIVVPAEASTLQVRFTFDTVDGYANSYIGWLIDDVKVIQQVAGTQPLEITTTCDDLPDGQVGQPYGPIQLQASGGVPPYTWTAQNLPAGVTCTEDGVVAGLPTAPEPYNPCIVVTDSVGNTAEQLCCPINISQAPPCPCKPLEQDFEGGIGQWTTTGLWHVTNAGCADNCDEITGNYAYFGQDATCDYATGAPVLGYLTSPQFDVDPCIEALLLEFHHYREVEAYNGAYDKTYVQISWDGGAWQTVWYKDSKDASPDCEDIVIGPIPRVGDKLRIRFVFDSVDKLYNGFTGWAIDDVTVWNADPACNGPAPGVGPLSDIAPQAVAPRDQISILNIPNPVRDVHTTTFIVRGVGIEAIRIQIFDIDQNLVYEEEVPDSELVWHTVNQYGEYLANGVYFYRALVKIGGEWIATKFQRLVILR